VPDRYASFGNRLEDGVREVDALGRQCASNLVRDLDGYLHSRHRVKYRRNPRSRDVVGISPAAPNRVHGADRLAMVGHATRPREPVQRKRFLAGRQPAVAHITIYLYMLEAKLSEITIGLIIEPRIPRWIVNIPRGNENDHTLPRSRQ
jgi:hypothetical protein